MEGISKDELIEVRKGLLSEGLNTDVIDALITLRCHELQEPWMTLDEFLKSGFIGVCFVFTEPYTILCERTNCGFFGTGGIMFDISSITHVMPIHKPEPPR